MISPADLPPLPALPPPGMTTRAILAVREGERIIVAETGTEHFLLVAETRTDEGWRVRALTPVMSREFCHDLAEAVVLRQARIVTWPHIVSALALGTMLALIPPRPEPENVAEPVAEAMPA